MSTDYTFYPCYMDDNIKPLYLMPDGDPVCILWRSRSFIDGEFFTTFQMVEPNELDKSFIKYFREDGYEPGEQTYAYLITESELEKHAGDGLVSGYVTVEQAKWFKEEGTEFLHSDQDLILPSDIVADMMPEERAKYVKIFGIDYLSSEWICSHLLKSLTSGFINEYKSKGVLMHVSW